MLYTEERVTVDGQDYVVTMAFPVPESEAETVDEKLKYLLNDSTTS